MADSRPIVSASTGVMVSLQTKLTSAARDEASSLKEVRTDVNSLSDELGSMDALLRSFAERDDPDLQVTEWMRQVRELAYDAEDCIDLYTHQHEQPPTTERRGGGGGGGGGGQARGFFPWMNRRPDMAKRIRELTDRIKEANKRAEAYRLVGADSKDAPCHAPSGGGHQSMGRHNSVAIDPLVLGVGGDRLVGIDKLRQALLTSLTGGDGDQAEMPLKVVSVVGAGGTGKTTLARKMSRCRKIHARFDCIAFVTVGRNPPMKMILLSILRQVTRQQHAEAENLDEHRVIEMIRESLQNMRYFVVVDDLWSPSAWKVIKCALPETNRGSRIVVITRSNEVAGSCSSSPSSVHLMSPLVERDAEDLFCIRIGCTREMYELHGLKEVFSNVFKTCGGVPLAFVAVAGLLARKFSELMDWSIAKNLVVSALDKCSKLQGMRRILHACYSDLSMPLKTCLLYLSCFPENHTIMKDRLVWRWIAEGFVPSGGDIGKTWSTGLTYFNELVNRRLIQPVVARDDDDDGCGSGSEPMGCTACTVHDVVLDFVVSMSSEENFVTSDAGIRSLDQPRDVIRRLSLNCSSQEDDGGVPAADSLDVSLSQVRSFTIFGGGAWLGSLLQNFRLLRVLDLQETDKLTNDDLKSIERLFRLRYLGLRGDGISKLPEKIGDLQFLEILDVRRTAVKDLPASIVRLRRLARLLATEFPMHDGMEKMASLQEVRMIKVNEATSPERLAELARQTNLRVLGINWCVNGNASAGTGNANGSSGGDGQGFAERFRTALDNIGALSKVESLLLHAGDATQTTLDGMVDTWKPPLRLHTFLMTSKGYCFPRVPPNMHKLSNLAHLTISIVKLDVQDLQLLGALPSLVVLKIRTRESAPTTITDSVLRCLQLLCFESDDGGLGLVFEEWAMPNLHELRLSFKAGTEVRSACIDHLFSLRQVHVQVHATVVDHCDAEAAAAVKDAEEAIREQLGKFKTQPVLEFVVDNKVMEKPEDQAGQVGQKS
uniref:AAA+ ATPase domain-containing protein n=1 Tax=Oryza barthii TaxID=65489 RepID=A0A0D3HX07_9ORYZ